MIQLALSPDGQFLEARIGGIVADRWPIRRPLREVFGTACVSVQRDYGDSAPELSDELRDKLESLAELNRMWP